MGTTRRTFLRGLMGLAAALSGVPRLRAAPGQRPVKHVIFLYLAGGPSHLDTFDPKPGTREGGPFRAIPTALAGVRFAEHLPRLAGRARDLVVVRNLTTREGSHERARALLHTGFAPIPGAAFPALGASLAHHLAPAGAGLPAYICLGGTGAPAGLLGPEHEPFVVRRADGAIPHVKPFPGVDGARSDARLALQRAVDQHFGRTVDAGLAAAHATLTDRTRALMDSPDLDVFDHRREPAAVQAAYGDTAFGRQCLVARRLIERGVTCVEVELGDWDCHKDNFTGHRNLSRTLDPAFAQLLADLAARDLLDTTLVLCAGEFGRSPSIGKEEGRDHHPACFSAVLAGGRLARGRVVGASDARGDRPLGAGVTVPDLLATVFAAAGIDPATRSMLGDRPITLANGGRPVREMLAS